MKLQDRDELVAQIIAEYRAELQGLTDEELYQHWKLQREVAQLTDEEWMEIAKNAKHGDVCKK